MSKAAPLASTEVGLGEACCPHTPTTSIQALRGEIQLA